MLRMHSLIVPACIVLGTVALLGGRRWCWAYAAFLLLGMLYFPARVGFELHPHACETRLNARLALLSLHNFPHMIQFAWFFLITAAQFRKKTASTMLLSGFIVLLMGAFVELAEGLTGKGNCRVRDLIPDATGALIGACLVLLWRQASARFWNTESHPA
jgi:VanZ family protein